MDKFPNINKITGDVPPEKVEEELSQVRNRSLERYKTFEIPATEEELQIIDSVSIGLQIMFKYVYKIDCKQILKDRFHIVKEGTLRDKYGRGMHQSPSGDIYLEPLVSHGSKIVFAKVLAHELIHYLSFSSVKVDQKNEETVVSPHISGLGIFKYEEAGVRDFFDVVDEAATAYISKRFLEMELSSARAHPEEKRAYTEECLAIDIIRQWLKDLPDSVDINKKEWSGPYVISIPRAEEMARIIQSDIPEEEKIRFYKENIASLPKEEKREFYLERVWEIEAVYKEISEMFALEESDPTIVREKTLQFVEKLALLKLTGRGFMEAVRFVEKRLGSGSFKRLAEKFAKFSEYKK